MYPRPHPLLLGGRPSRPPSHACSGQAGQGGSDHAGQGSSTAGGGGGSTGGGGGAALVVVVGAVLVVLVGAQAGSALLQEVVG